MDLHLSGRKTLRIQVMLTYVSALFTAAVFGVRERQERARAGARSNIDTSAAVRRTDPVQVPHRHAQQLRLARLPGAHGGPDTLVSQLLLAGRLSFIFFLKRW